VPSSLSTDPTVIFLPDSSSLNKFYFSFYLYHLLKEPIPFEIQCQIQQNDFEPMSINSLIIFRSFSIHVTRQIPITDREQTRLATQSNREYFI